ncbi:MAG: hydroxymethylglutaryl-CoA lyase [Peptococcaceae bacterium]|jgi:hydroxymethylglutaryl-CoA lyase|nr:hydroxymethylglutaryl-CoA lyase [Peptococcaceae bacterium]MDH7525828.1 hydroxymethylglutaryl-CoA lyase [Peptococcaceae bacterium]
MSYPAEVQVVEVGPRDGFQNVEAWIPTEKKLKVIAALLEANLKRIEVTSFVNPRSVPQMRDAALVAKGIREFGAAEFIALVPNLAGARAAFEAGIKEVTFVISASERHNMQNVRRTIAGSFEELQALKNELPELRIKLGIATAFGCPFQGDVPVGQVIEMMERGLSLPVDEICLCDTTGMANPRQVEDVLSKINSHFGGLKYGLHLHDTGGMGLANVVAALQQGVTVFDSSVGGLGGCPFSPGASGNIATEDLVNMLHRMGIRTNVDLPRLFEAARMVRTQTGAV